MISSDNAPINEAAADADFTVAAYAELLTLAKRSYAFASYREIPWGTRFVLWRHDCDYSLNRARALAGLEAASGVRATYFINPHCEFYNPYEAGQRRLVAEILELGHELGLHFDASVHAGSDASTLEEQLLREAALLQDWYGVRPVAFSFHNPRAEHLLHEADSYGGLVNCYSGRFKAEVGYCSDSNGYWRFRRLRDVLQRAEDPCLQVLTHPGWWQDAALAPRQRIFRCAQGRADAVLHGYDSELAAHGRINHAGASSALGFLRQAAPARHRLLDWLWMSEEFETLFVELWRLQQRQCLELCRAWLSAICEDAVAEPEHLLAWELRSLDGCTLFEAVFAHRWQLASGSDAAAPREWAALGERLLRGRAAADPVALERACVGLCHAIETTAVWGKAHAVAYDGLGATRPQRVAAGRPAETWPALEARLLEYVAKRGVGA